MLPASNVYQYICFRKFLMFIVMVVILSSASGNRWAQQRTDQAKPTWRRPEGASETTQGNNTEWDYLMLSLQWPQTFCSLSSDDNVTCIVPKDVNAWTIHGLWPSTLNNSAPDPFFCNNSWKFDINQVKDLEAKLFVQWPNLLVDKALDSLWVHEWEKHGTCAASLPALNSQHNYFAQTLAQDTTYNLLQLLKSQGIIPSADKQYRFDNVVNALTQVLKAKIGLECYVPLENPQVFYLAEVRICMDKSFKIMSCIDSFMEPTNSVLKQMEEHQLKKGILGREYEPCSNSKPLMIPPIQHK